MASTLVTALKSRELKEAVSYTGYEGGDKYDDDWLLVDCFNVVVHLMLPKTREGINLESHWEMKDRPHATYHKDAEKNENEYEKLIDKNPVPDFYEDMVGSDFFSSIYLLFVFFALDYFFPTSNPLEYSISFLTLPYLQPLFSFRLGNRR